MTGNDANVNSIKPGKLLELAHFLTRFQKHYTTPNDDDNSDDEASDLILVKMEDLEAVTRYRRNFLKKESLNDRYYVAEEGSKSRNSTQAINRLQAKRLEKEIEVVNSKVSSSKRTKRIHHLLLRFEVWTTKVLAQKDFVTSCGALLEDTKKTKYSHFSPHLNIPCSDHFCNILPEVSQKEWSTPKLPSAMHHMPSASCTLPVTPNKHTWQEFAKISRMISILDETSRTEIYKSSSCIFDIKGRNSYKEIYNQQYEFQPLDLVALWVRAQRDSKANRHLNLLFEIQYGNQENASSKIKAVYKGNPFNTHRVCEASPKADQLVEWAVTNQVLFSYDQVRSHIQLACLKQKRKNRDEEERSQRKRKRQRRDGNSDEQDLDQLRQACCVFVLRWFGRRHRKLTSVLFSKKQNILHLDIGCREGDRNGANLLHEKVDEGIQNYLLKPEINGKVAFAKDKTLARIDRRIRNYGNQITLKSQVETLLDALYSAGKSHGVRLELKEAAKSDFRMLHRHFFEEPENALEAAAMLTNIEDESITSITNLLNGAPSPWQQHCAHCDYEGVENNPLRTCACCASPFHEGCTSWRGEPVSDIISSYPPLGALCTVQLPPTETLPNFRDNNAVKWTEMEILVERRLDDIGWLEMSLGLSMAPTESCYDSFKNLTDGTILDLAKMIAADKSNQRPSFPMALTVNGSLIYDVANGNCVGNRAGLRKGDVVQHLQIVELFDRADISSLPPQRSFDFQSISNDDRINAFKIPAKKIKVHIVRPSIDIVESSHDWYEQVKVRNKARTAAMSEIHSGDICSKLWQCGNCQCQFTQEKQTPRSVKEEAEFCRAVIRRIGMESYAHSFEAERTAGNDNCPAVSLRRLDAMMTHIVNRHSVAGKSGESSARSFLNPPWVVEGGSHLAWTAGLEERPMELLCKGVGTISESASLGNGGSRNAADVTAMFRHFLIAFSSWCVLPCKGNRRTRGPPPLFRSMLPPWILPSCTICSGRPVAAGNAKVCNNPACSTLARSNYFQMDDFPDEEVATLARTIEMYESRSSLVGTTFLVHHDDPLVKAVSKVVNIEHNRRPVEFVIASYLPKEFRDTVLNGNQIWEGDKCSDDDGIFHLLPVISATQIDFLLDRLKTRKKPAVSDSTGDASWASLEALNVPGVARYSFSDVERKRFESAKIRIAMEGAVVRKCMLPPKTTGACNEIIEEPSRFELIDFVVSQLEPLNSVAYGSCLTSAASHLLSQDEFQPGVETVTYRSKSTPRSNWPIAARAGNGTRTRQDVFGETLLLPRLRSIVCAPELKYDVLIPKQDDCVLVYSDLHFESDEDCARLKRQLQPEVLNKPRELNLSSRSFSGRSKTILLLKLDSEIDSGCQGVGWGFELVRWEHEEALRVGRIRSLSPAQRAGLQTDDVITSVGGRKINSFDQVNLISTILGASNVCVRTEDSLVEPEGIISTVLGNIVETCNLDPVVLKVYRPSQESDESLARDSSNLQLVAQRHQTLQSIELDSTKNPIHCADDEVLVLGTINHSTQPPNQLQVVSRDRSQNATVLQDTSRHQLASGVATTARVPKAPKNQTFDRTKAFSALYIRLHTHHGRRPVLSTDHLYFPAKNGVILTLGETALLLECFKRQQPKLGIRLLCPRYNPALVRNQFKIMATWTSQVIQIMPKLTDQMFASFMALDWRRAINKENPEIGEVVFREANPDATSSDDAFWTYRYPVDRLPVDRCLERLLASAQQTQSQQMHYQQQFHHHENQPPPHQQGQSQQIHYQQQFQHHENQSFPHQQAQSQQMQYQQHFQHHENQSPTQYGSPPSGMEPSLQYGPQPNGPPHYDPPPDPLKQLPYYGPQRNPLEPPPHYDPQLFEPPTQNRPPQVAYRPNESNQATHMNGERIRGGGTSIDDEVGRTRLSEIPVKQWNGLPVYMLVQTEESKENKMLVGFVNPEPDVKLVAEMTIDVECHFLEDIGEFVDAVMHKEASNEIFVIDMTANDGYSATASSVIRELYAKGKGPAKNRLNHTDTNAGTELQDGGDQKLSIDANNSNTNHDGLSPKNTAAAAATDSPEIQSAPGSNLLNQAETAVTEHESRQETPCDTSCNSTLDREVPRQSSSLPPPNKTKGQMNYLGDFPDGRNCFWIVNDPEALYITIDQLNDSTATRICQQQYSFFLDTELSSASSSSNRLVMRNSDRYHCPWGCFLAKDKNNEAEHRETLSFTSKEDLVDHYKYCFSYGDLSGFFDVGVRSRCVRISDGQKIRDLYCDLSSALYVRSQIFDFFTKSGELPTKTSKSGTRFSQSPTGRRIFLVIDDKFSSKIEQVQDTLSVHESAIVCGLARLMESISSRFEVRTTGNLRFDDHELLKYCSVEETRSLVSVNVDERERLQEKKRLSSDTLCSNCIGCDLCTLPWEKTVKCLEPNTTDAESEHCFGSGCCLINTLIRSSGMRKALPGSLGEAKVLILEIGDIVPEQLKVREPRRNFDPLFGCRLWDENNHDVWKRFVTEATCAGQLSQAYVTLLASIQKELLPGWWRTDGAGWSTPHVILVNGKLSSLLLHVYILDAAIAEYRCQKLYSKNTGPSSNSILMAAQRPKPRKVTGTATERMKKYMDLALKQGYELNKGANGSECCICDDGGNLLCCDLCPKVQHAACCEPRIEGNPNTLDTFICNVCINDIEESMEFM
ncbi:unnamed protein product [Cylindrotheca closterium]|uniref:Uncharacterized protein n=1 Tax=Cylindrotheca closterium TaxID=2856 RepID=A0AAD2GAI7_9STRA|nr:unnamed protein product [Cylindrotheca closterium]